MDGENENVDEVMLPGFRFHPTDEELVGFYLRRKIQRLPLSIELIRQLDIYKYDPWDLPKLATTGEKEWYFYCPRDRKYRNSTRPNRVTEAGFWKATGTDRPIYSSHGSVSKCIGLKKSLVFYRGRAAKGVKTDWMMHEFRLPSPNDAGGCPSPDTDKVTDSWAICKIFRKTSNTSQRPSISAHHNYRPLIFSPPLINYDTRIDENHALTIDSLRNQQLDAARWNPIIEEPCRPSLPNDEHSYGLDPSKLVFQPLSDPTYPALPSMPYSIIPHPSLEAQVRSHITVDHCDYGKEEQLPFKSIMDSNVGGETRGETNLYDFDSAPNLVGSTRGDENAWIPNLIWDYDLPLWHTFCDLPTYKTDCYT